MKRKLIHLATILSLVACVATVTLWVRSYWYLDDLALILGKQRFWLIRSAEGRLHLQQTSADTPYWKDPPRYEYWTGSLAKVHYAYLPFTWRVAGFGYGHPAVASAPGGTIRAHVYLMPHAFAAAALALPPAMVVRRAVLDRRKRRRLAAGLCAQCGYDLRSSPDRCPECGAIRE